LGVGRRSAAASPEAAFRPAARGRTLLRHHAMIELAPLLKSLVASLVFVAVGLAVFGIAFFIIAHLVTPFSIRKELEKDQNIAIGIVIGSVILGLSIIIAAAIHGG
jgi:putative membrane protein